jgi:hypothetical protein
MTFIKLDSEKNKKRCQEEFDPLRPRFDDITGPSRRQAGP